MVVEHMSFQIWQYKNKRRMVVLTVSLALLTACGQVTVQPTLSSSVAIEALEELGEIRRAPVHVGILIDQKLRDLVFRVERPVGVVGQAVYNVAAGRAIAAKLIKLASYQFEEISLVQDRQNAPPLLLTVGLQQEQPGLTVDVARRGITALYDVKTKIDLRLRATLHNRGEQIWVGTARVTEELQTGGLEGSGGAIDISRGISESIDRATDRLVANLMRQVRRSASLKKYLEEQRQ
ncbi:MAG: hypothetical protein KatS3mg131_0301 [Candidatus Tectimicrobiota bacterium]|nr:MAG: hypothetical protein KatS3mg131_0301 [Candidatus Tectomicrobia bacterium]